MKLTWEAHTSWVAVFDILGFKERIRNTDNDLPRAIVTSRLEDLIDCVQKRFAAVPQHRVRIISDTIVIYAADCLVPSYSSFIRACKSLIVDSIRLRLPLQGAISAGATVSALEQAVLTGPAFVEAYEHCEAQNWIGLLLCASATSAVRLADLEPMHHDFVSAEIPWRKRRAPPSSAPSDVLAYRFQNGAANYSSPLLPWLREMEGVAPEPAKEKYNHTIEFIERHYRYIAAESGA